MKFSGKIYEKFEDDVGDGFEVLDIVCDWISDNLDPEDVFSNEQLAAWERRTRGL